MKLPKITPIDPAHIEKYATMVGERVRNCRIDQVSICIIARMKVILTSYPVTVRLEAMPNMKRRLHVYLRGGKDFVCMDTDTTQEVSVNEILAGMALDVLSRYCESYWQKMFTELMQKIADDLPEEWKAAYAERIRALLGDATWTGTWNTQQATERKQRLEKATSKFKEAMVEFVRSTQESGVEISDDDLLQLWHDAIVTEVFHA